MIERTLFIHDREGRNKILEIFIKGNDVETKNRLVKMIYNEFDHHDIVDSDIGD